MPNMPTPNTPGTPTESAAAVDVAEAELWLFFPVAAAAAAVVVGFGVTALEREVVTAALTCVEVK